VDWGVFATTVSASAVVSALVAGLFAERSSKRAIQIENITKERAKWRDKIRGLALAVYQAATQKNGALLKEQRLSLSLNLNPIDEEDTAILNAIDKMSQSEQLDEKVLHEFSDRVALLLKHDWERAKVEAKQADFASRITYADFIAGRNRAEHADTGSSSGT
jgi:hypothetical protein